MRCVAVTGAASPIGEGVVRALAALPEVETVLGIDVRAPAVVGPKIVTARRGPREPLADLFLERWIDSAVFLAWTPDRADLGAADVTGSGGLFLDACHRAGILEVVVGSSARVYGPSWDRPAPRPERSPLDGERLGSPQVSGLVALERGLHQFGEDHPELNLAVARPCWVLGPGTGDVLGRLLKRRLPLLPAPTAPVQIIHADDYAAALVALLRGRCRGAFNVAPPEVLGPDDLARLVGRPVRAVRADLLGRGLEWGERWGLAEELGPGALEFVSAPWLADGGAFRRETGFGTWRGAGLALRDWLGGDVAVGRGVRGILRGLRTTSGLRAPPE